MVFYGETIRGVNEVYYKVICNCLPVDLHDFSTAGSRLKNGKVNFLICPKMFCMLWGQNEIKMSLFSQG